MQELDFGMTKEEVRAQAGDDYVVLGGRQAPGGKRIEGWRYQESAEAQSYDVYFVNGRLAQWGATDALREFPELGAPTEQ